MCIEYERKTHPKTYSTMKFNFLNCFVRFFAFPHSVILSRVRAACEKNSIFISFPFDVIRGAM